MSEENGTTSTEITTPIGKLAISGKKTAEFITVILAIGVGIISYVLWKHDARSEVAEVKITGAMDRIADSQRFFACIIAQPQDDRMKQIENPNSLCNRLSKP